MRDCLVAFAAASNERRTGSGRIYVGLTNLHESLQPFGFAIPTEPYASQVIQLARFRVRAEEDAVRMNFHAADLLPAEFSVMQET